ncbi:MAG: electron transport complex subunit RsxC [Candidatus Eisenbacteria bacterium]
MAKTFGGGVHVADSKSATSSKPISEIAPPPRVIIPLSQHIGAPATPIVKPGEKVRIGSKIAEADGFVSVPVHASVAGTVKSIAEFPHPLGHSMPAVEIENDGTDLWVEPARSRDLSEAPPDTIRDAIREAGIVGLGGAAFPTHVKLSPPEGKRITTVVLNGAECEPYLTGDHRLMVESAMEVVEGLRIMMRVVGAERGVIGVERNKADAVGRLKETVRGEQGIDVIDLKVKYPQGAEKQLIHAVTGREVPRGGLPMDVGCIVQNVGTSLAVHDAVKYGRPLVSRVLTLAGSAANGPGNFRVRIGTPFSHVIASAGGASDNCRKIVMGGPMMGITQTTDEVPVVKGTSGIVLLADQDMCLDEPGPCLRCGRCVDHCPMRLMPNELARFVETGMVDRAEEYGVLDCIECGVCAYVCPSKIRHVQLMKEGKAEVLARRKRAEQTKDK